MNAIRDWLYIGKYAETTNISLLQANSIDAMLLLAQEVNHPEIKTLYLPVDDGTELPFDVLQKGIKFALKTKAERQKAIGGLWCRNQPVGEFCRGYSKGNRKPQPRKSAGRNCIPSSAIIAAPGVMEFTL